MIVASSGGYGSEVNQWLFAESERLARPLRVYSIGNYGVGAVEMVDWVKSIEKNNSPHKISLSEDLLIGEILPDCEPKS
jgi:hypothetical protein